MRIMLVWWFHWPSVAALRPSASTPLSLSQRLSSTSSPNISVRLHVLSITYIPKKGKGSLYSITECRVPELIPVLAVSLQVTWVINLAVGCALHSARPAVTPSTLKRAATNFAAWWTDAWWVWTVCLRLLPATYILHNSTCGGSGVVNMDPAHTRWLDLDLLFCVHSSTTVMFVVHNTTLLQQIRFVICIL